MFETSVLDTDKILITLQSFGLRLLLAAATFTIGRWLARWAVRAVQMGMERAKVDSTLRSFLGNVAYGVLLAVVVVTALGQLGVSTTSAAALLGGAGVAIGLSLKDQLASFAAGVMLIMFRPFKQGDFIEAGGILGTVEDIRIIATVLRTPNNQEVTVPNAEIWGATITNFSAKTNRRIDLPIGIAYDADIRKARDIATQICSDDSRVLNEPTTWIGVTELADSAVILTVRPWVLTPDYWQTRSDLLEKIKLAFDAADIVIPFNQLDVHLHQDSQS